MGRCHPEHFGLLSINSAEGLMALLSKALRKELRFAVTLSTSACLV
jgi:hypothetical protein